MEYYKPDNRESIRDDSDFSGKDADNNGRYADNNDRHKDQNSGISATAGLGAPHDNYGQRSVEQKSYDSGIGLRSVEQRSYDSGIGLRSSRTDKKKKIKQKKAKGQGGVGIRNTIIAFLTIVIFLLLAVIFCCMWFIVAPASETVHTISPESNISEEVQYKEPTEEELIARGWIPSDLIKKYADEFNINSEFMSKIFPNKIIYKDGGKIVYANIDPNLKKHPYDWQWLSWDKNRPAYNTNTHTALLGIDVSKYQAEIDWGKVAADGIGFAMIRLGYRGYSSGALVMDEYFKANIRGAQDAGLKIGVYFFSQAIDTAEAIEEAEYILAEIDGYKVEFPIVFDMEEISGAKARTDNLTRSQVSEIITAFCERIKLAGHTPMIYGNSKWFASRMDLEKLEDYEKWLAQYFKIPSFPYDFSMWQFTESGTVNGIKGKVDIDAAFVDFSSKTP